MLKRLLATTLLVLSSLTLVSTATATQTNPNADHKVTLCHRTGSASGGNQHNGYDLITVDIASSGLVKGGHAGHEQIGNGPGGDLIPPYDAYAKVKGEWVKFSYAGKGDWFLIASGCAADSSSSPPPPPPPPPADRVKFCVKHPADLKCVNTDTALTGSNVVVPGFIAVVLALLGSAALWVARKRL